MKKLVELLGQRPCKGDVGVEIECEGNGIQISDSPFWRTEKDGSLRGVYPSGCAEFVMARPVDIDNVELALDSLINEQKNAVFDFSFRTSVHVHVNVQQLTEAEMLAFLYLCLLVEEPLMNFCGETRKANRFCLRYADAEGFDKTLDMLFDKGARAIERLEGDKIRYAAINVHALQKYGSIEFRGMRGNMDKDVILPWCRTLVHLRNRAQALGSPINVFNRYIGMSNEDFIAESLGPYADKFAYAEQQRDVERSFSLTIDLPHIFKARKPVKEEEPIKAARHPLIRPARPDIGRAELDTLLLAEQEFTGWLLEDDNEEMSLDDRLEVFIDMFKDAKGRQALRRAAVEQEARQERDRERAVQLQRMIKQDVAAIPAGQVFKPIRRKKEAPVMPVQNPQPVFDEPADNEF